MQSSTTILLSHPPIHYVWIGPPSESSSDAVIKILEHDVKGPKQMADQNKSNPIVFFCLKEYLSHYRETFAGKPNVQVSSIEDYIEEVSKSGDAFQKKFAAIVLKNITTLLKRGSVRDFVTVKEIFSLFLVAVSGGYFMDTNVSPLTSGEVILPWYDRFQAPVLDNSNVECWMFHAPKYDSVIKAILETYLSHWGETEVIYNPKNYFESYHTRMGNLIIDSIEKHLQRPTAWELEDDGNSCRINITKLNLQKTYYNTHKYAVMHNTKPRGILCWAIMNADTKFLSDIIDKGLDVNEYKIAGKSPLFFALIWGRIDSVDLLLSKGAVLSEKETSEVIYEVIKTNEVDLLRFILTKLKVDVNQFIYHKSLLKHARDHKSRDVAVYLEIQGAKAEQTSGLCCRFYRKHKSNAPAVDEEKKPLSYVIS